MSFEERLAACQEFNDVGGCYFKEGQYYRAGDKYKMVTGCLWCIVFFDVHMFVAPGVGLF
jgi:hypothetical protein